MKKSIALIIFFLLIFCEKQTVSASEKKSVLPNPFLRPGTFTADSASEKLNSTLGLSELISGKFCILDMSANIVSTDILEGKFIGVYFSAGWCGPCRRFTPLLQTFRDKNNKIFEVIFVSLDGMVSKSSDEINLLKKRDYMKSENMNWYTNNSNCKDARRFLKKAIGRIAIPTLAVFSSTGKIISNTGTKEITKDPKGVIGKWKRKSE